MPNTQDPDGDGWLEKSEAEAFVGPELVLLGSPTADASGNIDYTQTFTVDATLLGDLTKRAFEIHGRTVPANFGAGTPGEVNGTGGYKADLPVAAGLITFVSDLPSAAVPLPAAGWMGASTMGAIALLGTVRRKRAV